MLKISWVNTNAKEKQNFSHFCYFHLQRPEGGTKCTAGVGVSQAAGALNTAWPPLPGN
jgi:hypothetical protein